MSIVLVAISPPEAGFNQGKEQSQSQIPTIDLSMSGQQRDEAQKVNLFPQNEAENEHVYDDEEPKM